MKNLFIKLGKRIDCEKLFSLGPFNRFENSSRVYMDEYDFSSIEEQTNFVISELEKKRPIDEWYTLFSLDMYENCFPKKDMEVIKNYDLIQREFTEYNFYDSDDELYRWIFATSCSVNINEYVIKLFLGRFYPSSENYIPSDLYFISKDFKYAVNVYDDRGMDFIEI